MLLELVSDIKYYKCGLGWDTSYKRCHKVLPPFVVPHIYLYHQQEIKVYQYLPGKVSKTTVGEIDKGDINPNVAPGGYH